MTFAIPSVFVAVAPKPTEQQQKNYNNKISKE